MLREVLFWSTLASIVYAYAGFPLLLLVRGLLVRRSVAKAPITPRVSLVIVAHNEAATIAAKIGNARALDYPRDHLEIIVASDGSNDGTNAIVERYADRGIRLLAFPRSGKIPALNAAVARATGDILVFSDANSMYEADALRLLVAPFADPAVGAVGGNQRYVAGGGVHVASFGERLYWQYDRLLKLMQSTAGSITAATGAIHAIRRNLFEPVPLGVSDDFMISTRAVARGYRLVFERNALANETVAPTGEAEFNRKLRVIVRGLRGLWIARDLFNPVRHGFYSVQLASHKLLRWSVCWLLIVLFLVSLSLYGAGGFYRFAAQGQIAFYALALAGWGLRGVMSAHYRLFKLLTVPFYFCLANFAALRAWFQLLAGKRVDLWDSNRAASPHGELTAAP